MKNLSLPLLALIAATTIVTAAEEPSSANNPQLKQALALYPDADLNRDGVLTMVEAKQAAKAAGIDITKGIPGVGAEDETFRPNVAYGPETRQMLDFWQPKSDKPTPVVLLIHGGGFKAGDKSDMARQMAPLRAALMKEGIACAAINYRFTNTAPLDEILRDGARATQFLRSKSAEWNIDKNRFGAVGGSAGAGMSLWLSTRDDLALPQSADPVLRESSRIGPVILIATQATYNFPRWDSFLGKPEFEQEPNEAAKMFRLATDADLATPAGISRLKECDMLAWISPDDGPILAYAGTKPVSNKTWGDYVHNPLHAKEIKNVCDKAGVSCELVSNRGTESFTFLVKNLKN